MRQMRATDGPSRAPLTSPRSQARIDVTSPSSGISATTRIEKPLVVLGPDRALVGPDDALVAAQAEGMADRVSVDPPAVAVGADGVLVQRRAEVEDAALLGLDIVYFEVQVELLGVLAVGPLRRAVVVHPDKGKLDLAELDAGPVLVAAFLD